MNRLLLIIGGALVIASGAITAAIGVAQWNSSDSLDQQAADMCESGETAVRTTRVNQDEGGLLTVFYCQNEDNVRREIEVTADEEEDNTLGLVLLMVGAVFAAIGLIMLTVGLVKKTPADATAGFEQFTPLPMTVTTLPGGVVSSNVVMLNGQQIDPNSELAGMIQQAFGAMNMAFDQMSQGGGMDVGGILQMALQQLDAAHAAGNVSDEDYQQAKAKIMKNMGQG